MNSMCNRYGIRRQIARTLRNHRARAGLAAAAFLALAPIAFAAAPAPITSIEVLHHLENAQAAKSLPVAFEATVTYHIKGSTGLFVQDGGFAIYADAPENLTLTPGDRVLVRGTTRASYRPEIAADSISVLGHGAVPAPAPAGYTQLVRGEFDCMRVTVSGKVRSADLVTYGKAVNIYLQLMMDGGSIDAIVNSSDGSMLEKLRGAEVEVAGSASGKFDSKDQLRGIVLKVPAISDVKILKQAPSDHEPLALTPMDEILEHSYDQDLSEQVRVEGTITYYVPGAAVVLQNGAKSLWIETRDEQPLKVGDRANASGYPAVRDGVLTLTAAMVQDSHLRSPITPQRIGWDELSSGADAFNLVSIEGQVVKEGREEYQDEYVLTAGGHLFSVLYQHTDEDLGFELPPMKQVPVGATVRVTGVSSVSYGSNPFAGPVGFDVLLPSFNDIAVVARPGWLNVRNLTRLVEFLAGIIFIFGIRVAWSERKARHHNATMAYIERRRGRILVDINNSKPLAEILEQITELVSTRLEGAPCWIEVEDGAKLGNYLSSDSLNGLRTARHPITGRSGAHLGTIVAAFHAGSSPNHDQDQALSQASDLATLAIETSRLYSDLVHRSEFDLLTEIHNRFSLEKHIETLIEASGQSAIVFGLLYVDLNDFKMVNDQFGHHTGDLYLHEVALRMKGQLRPGDVLARLGGDEFAVVVSRIHSRSDVEVVACRLEACFLEPFKCETYEIRGSASIGIAMFPEDGTSKDGLLGGADAAMYKAKKDRHRSLELQVEPQRPGA